MEGDLQKREAPGLRSQRRHDRVASSLWGEQRRPFMGNWQLDPYHTQVEFSAKHLAMMTVRGYFDELSAIADVDPEHPETPSVEVPISTASIRTNNGIRANDRRSSNFLEVQKYPETKFKRTMVE